MRRLLAAAAALFALLALAGCAGVREDEPTTTAAAAGRPPSSTEVRLVISRDLGAIVIKDVTVSATDDLTVMRLLAEHATVDTQYSGGFVKAIDGLASTYGSVGDGDAQDWFYWVDGVMGDVGANEYRLHGGDTVWWDYHAWADAMFLPATIDAFPTPWSKGTMPLTADVNAAVVRKWATASGISLGATEPLGSKAPMAGIVVATAAEARATPWLRDRLAGKDGGSRS